MRNAPVVGSSTTYSWATYTVQAGPVCGPDGLLHSFIRNGDGGETSTTHATVPIVADEGGVIPAGGTSDGAVTVASTAPVAFNPVRCRT